MPAVTPEFPATLPTPLALATRRLGVVEPRSGEMFLLVSYVAEVAIKLVAIAFWAGLGERAKEAAYQMAYELLRADGLGSWESWIRQASSQSLARFQPPFMHDLLGWSSRVRTRPEDEWYRAARGEVESIFQSLELESPFPHRKPTICDLLSALVQVRNKTKAHGAVGPDFFEKATEPYFRGVLGLVRSCPAFAWKWVHLLRRDNTRNRGILLSTTNPSHLRDADVEGVDVASAGVYLWPPAASAPLFCGDLIHSNRECSEFHLPVGMAGSQVEFLNYATGATARIDMEGYSRPPAFLPPSDTEGLPELDVQSNLFGNLPALPTSYVSRGRLESQLRRLLTDANHPIVTLHGYGGIGKTSLALRVLHDLSAEQDPHFDYVVWFSARDIDLRPAGPVPVKAAITDLSAMARRFGELFDCEPAVESLAEALHAPRQGAAKGVLFVLDNLESVRDLKGVYSFFDSHTCIPNKVLITSRHRSFKADFPLEVLGMDRGESAALMRRAGEELQISGLVTDEVIDAVFDYSGGHPYVIRIVLGEMSKEGRYVPPRNLMTRRGDIVDAVVQGSFDRLSESGQRVFLTVSGWRSAISEAALLVVLGQRGFDVESGIDECVRLSLVERRLFLDDQPAYVAPQIARLFGRKKLEGDPDRLVILEDLDLLQKFGVVPAAGAVAVPQSEHLRRFLDWSISQSSTGSASQLRRLDETLELLARVWPEGWLGLARFRQAMGASPESIGLALRRAVEENPNNLEAWQSRASFEKAQGNDAAFVSSRLRAVEISPGDRTLVREVALDVCRFINDHSVDIPVARRSVYVASLRERMKEHADFLDATGLSRLAWLYLLEGNQREAWRFASMGLVREKDNKHCMRIIERLRSQGYIE